MAANNNVDIKLVQLVNTKLTMRGIRSPCNVSVACKGGEVTLTGTVAQPHQKNSAGSVAQGVTGVKRVINQLTVKAQVRT
ncbi:MAG: BON domain-containing protein [Pirellula sp.]